MMDTEMMQFLTEMSERISVIGVLLYAWIRAEKRGDRLEAKLIMNQDIEAAKET